jgi:hypothetical protein
LDGGHIYLEIRNKNSGYQYALHFLRFAVHLISIAQLTNTTCSKSRQSSPAAFFYTNIVETIICNTAANQGVYNHSCCIQHPDKLFWMT